MNNKIMFSILKHKTESQNSFQITVVGNSMFPVLKDGDKVLIKKAKEYEVGSVIVFKYNDEGLLIHRILEIKDGKYYCKGDNCYRLEEVGKNDIIGKVLDIPSVDIDFINMSLEVNKEFVRNDYDYFKTIESNIYKKYKQKYLKETTNNEFSKE
ncbi:MAG: signal peptidase I [Candidatus Margulisbacteria bacterium GWF2_35_9]|nr:MAG: signal peptidase I [Candidatus Margulisbacteria bacterium GWF2_35_9]